MKKVLLTLLLLLLAAPAQAAEKESAYDRVMRTGTIRCAWATAAVFGYKDAATGNISGPLPAIAEKMAETLDLKVEWTAEVGYADFAEGLKSGRYDAFCGALAIVPGRARAAAFTTPTIYVPVFMHVAEGDDRYKTLADANKPEVTAGTIDGENFQLLTRKYLPKAKEYSKPNMAPQSDLLVDLVNGKFDVAIHDSLAVRDFNAHSDKKIRRAFPEPVATAAWGYGVAPDEHKLLNLFNVAILNMHLAGMIDDIFTQHDMGDDIAYRVALPYKEPK